MQNLSSTSDQLDALIAAFAAAEYVVDALGEAILLRVGESAPALDRQTNDQPWAVITAHNPDGRLCDPDTNAEAQRLLARKLRALQPAVLLSVCNRDPADQWPDEPAWLFTPQNDRELDGLARHFGQRAVLTGRPGSKTRLRIYVGPNHASGTPAAVVL